ncbi:DUF1344 domain-containing protein [Aminobacter sp. AP02]|uniref:DUF1344 domain-containing protein n=1 Tax=Aminobacter sp. AP02 TaxID=2135737 RepID=UPI000D7AD7BF|nr:DUF1344 domain-containing protein [Aminobacter sp. AP02]PWK71741.1 uncharacterized protein DUF1344 [Aminobacter sp. AP02]
MKKFVLALAVAGTLSFPAFADANGVVKEYNKETRVITLEDGTSWTIDPSIAIPPEVAAGAKVDIQTDKNDNTKVVNVLINP